MPHLMYTYQPIAHGQHLHDFWGAPRTSEHSFFITMMTVLKSFCTILSIKIKEWITVFSSLRAYQDRVMMTQFAHCHFKIRIDELGMLFIGRHHMIWREFLQVFLVEF